MPTTRSIPRHLRLVAAAAALPFLAACGAANSDAQRSEEPAAALQERLPVDLASTLERDELRVQSVDPGPQALATSSVLDAFTKLYDPTSLPAAPTLYFVQIDDSPQAMLREGSTAWVMHVPGVEQDATGPMPRDHKAEDPVTPVILKTDMFAFFDPSTGEHLVTDYIGPPMNDR